jgi:hypothetical protein
MQRTRQTAEDLAARERRVHEEPDDGAVGRHRHARRAVLARRAGGGLGLDLAVVHLLRRALLALELELAQEARDEEEVVVVHPDEVARLEDGEHRAREGGVGGLVGGPVRVRGGVLGRDVLPEEVVEERPERCAEVVSDTLAGWSWPKWEMKGPGLEKVQNRWKER